MTRLAAALAVVLAATLTPAVHPVPVVPVAVCTTDADCAAWNQLEGLT